MLTVFITRSRRDALGLTTGQPLEIAEPGGWLKIAPSARPDDSN